MGTLIGSFRRLWLSMLEPPWRNTGSEDERGEHWVGWFIGWSWSLPGLLLGALIAPSLVHWAGLSDPQYQAWLVVGVAVLGGFLVQLLGVLMTFLVYEVRIRIFLAQKKIGNATKEDSTLVSIIYLEALALPVVGVGYAIYRYLTWVGEGQRSVTIAFVGGLLVKTFLIPLIKGLVTGAGLKWFMRWLRGVKRKLA